jgi:hypothetical protein
MPYAKCYVSDKLLGKMKAEGFYKVTPKSGEIIVVFDPEKSKDGVYNVHFSEAKNDIRVYTSKGNENKKQEWTDYIVNNEKIEACNNLFDVDGKFGNYYTLEKEESREKLPYTEFSKAAKEFDELPKGTVICHSYGSSEEIERKVT